MIENISIWAEQIIVAVIIATLIEMILPNGNNKKYIKAVIGVYILFTIVSPVFGGDVKFNVNEIDYESYLKNSENYQAMSEKLTSYNDQSVEEIYIANLKHDMKQKLKQQGYLVQKITIKLDFEKEENYGKLNEIYLTVSKIEELAKKEQVTNQISVNAINKVSIGNTQDNTISNEENKTADKISSSEEKQLKEYLSSVYEVKQKSIFINEDT